MKLAIGLMTAALLTSAVLAATPKPATAQASAKPLPQAAPADARAGGAKAASEGCFECHQADGNSLNGQFSRLAGLHPAYLEKQLRDFQSGARKQAVMTPMAGNLSEADIRDLAAYFASQTPKLTPATTAVPLAEQLYRQGDAGRQIVACASCHGSDGKGAADGSVPRLAGQHSEYLATQLRLWRSGSRSNSADGAMNQLARPLSNPEIEALAGYLAGL